MTDERPRYQHWFRCRVCSHRYHVTRLTADSSKVKIPKCPLKSCGGKSKPSHMPDVGMDVAAGKAPAQVGSNLAKAYETAATMVMEDHGLTDLQDHRRAGESTAPKLPPHLQKKADAFWGGQQNQGRKKTMSADLSPIFGERATQAQGAQTGMRFKADAAPAVAPILQHQAPGTSPVPPHRIVAG